MKGTENLDSPVPYSVSDLQLDDEDEDMTADDEKPRCLLYVWRSGEILAYGGSGSDIRKIITGSSSSSTISSSGSTPITEAVRHWKDEQVRAVAISTDGKRVVVANDVSELKSFTYDINDDSKNEKEHPFCRKADATSMIPINSLFDSPIRDLQFYPNNSDWIAVATEGGMALLCLKDNTNTKYLWDLVEEHHDGSGIRSVAFHQLTPTVVVLASLAMDGRLCIWDVSDVNMPGDWKLVVREASKCIPKNDVGEMLDADAWDRSCRPIFLTVPRNKPNASERTTVLALPGMTYLQLRRLDCDQNGRISMENFDQPNVDNTVVQGHIEPIVAMTSSNNSSYLLTSGRDKRVVLWSIQQRKDDGSIAAKFLRQLGEFESAPTSMLWDKNVESEKLFIACANGKLIIIEGREHIAPKKKVTIIDELDKAKRQSGEKKTIVKVAIEDTDNDDEKENEKKNDITIKNGLLKKHSEDDSTSDDDEDITFSQNDIEAPGRKNGIKNAFIDDEAAEDDFQNHGEAVAAVSSLTKRKEESIYDDIIDKASPRHGQSHDDDSLIPDADDYDHDSYEDGYNQRITHHDHHANLINLPEPQAPFGVSSTPLDLPRRFLCWNHIGSITFVRGEDLNSDRNSISIHFTDSFSRRNISFTDNLGFILGSLGEDGAVFATDVAGDEDDDDDILQDDDLAPVLSKKTKEAVKRSQKRKDLSKPTGSTLYFNRFETFGNVRDKDWVLTLPSGERVVGCACGEGWAAAITSRRFLRLYSSGGNQGHVMWLPGEPITIIGRSKFVAVFFHESNPLLNGTQKIGYMLMNASTAQVVAKGSVSSISSASMLLWAGFGNDYSLNTMDGEGMVSMLVCSSPLPDSNLGAMNWEWVPMLDTVGLKKSSDDSFWPISVFDGKLVCVPLKGGTKYPDATRRPVTTALNFRMPLATGTFSKCTLEEVSLRAGIALHQKKILRELCSQVDKTFEREYFALSAKVDKVTLKMFASIIEAGKLERALDLVDRLHLEKSYELAMTIADSHRKLVDMIESAKERKFFMEINDHEDRDYDDVDDGSHSRYTSSHQSLERKRISPDSTQKGKMSAFSNLESRNVRPRHMHA